MMFTSPTKDRKAEEITFLSLNKLALELNIDTKFKLSENSEKIYMNDCKLLRCIVLIPSLSRAVFFILHASSQIILLQIHQFRKMQGKKF